MSTDESDSESEAIQLHPMREQSLHRSFNAPASYSPHGSDVNSNALQVQQRASAVGVSARSNASTLISPRSSRLETSASHSDLPNSAARDERKRKSLGAGVYASEVIDLDLMEDTPLSNVASTRTVEDSRVNKSKRIHSSTVSVWASVESRPVAIQTEPQSLAVRFFLHGFFISVHCEKKTRDCHIDCRTGPGRV